RAAVVKRSCSAQDTVDEVFCLARERFHLFDTGNPQVAGTVTDAKIITRIAVTVGSLDSLVVDLDFLVRFEIIPDEHLLLAANKRGAYLNRREPVHIQMSDDFVREIHRDESYVFGAIHVLFTGGDNSLRSILDQV